MSIYEHDDDQDGGSGIEAWPTLYVDGESVEQGRMINARADGSLRVQVEHDDVASGYEVTGGLSWLNSAAIVLDYERDEASVSLSVGDPRGAFVFTIRRRPDTGELLLHVPCPGEGLPHMPIQELRPGAYRIGS